MFEITGTQIFSFLAFAAIMYFGWKAIQKKRSERTGSGGESPSNPRPRDRK